MRIACGLLAAVAILLPISGVCLAATQDDPRALSDTYIIGAMAAVIAGLLSLWLRSLNTAINDARTLAKEAHNKIDNLEPTLKFTRQVDSMLAPLRTDVDLIKRMMYAITPYDADSPPPHRVTPLPPRGR